MDKDITPRSLANVRCNYAGRLINRIEADFMNDGLHGQMLGVLTLLDALLATHPDRERLQAAFVKAREDMLTFAIPSGISEECLQGMYDVHERAFASMLSGGLND